MSTKKQLLATLLILIGAILLIYTMIEEQSSVYFKIFGVIFLMIGLFRATRVWVDDNKKIEDEE
ncbi:hypothetical protein [Mesonia sp.]|uniref:hypothetical protein n=1 Tax=Mesonia sp. TaxID=1960830 RepID=UPI0017702906|nr:hypothetical protein [Mesonia sp.]HIB37403.1 hypothetical protein [Mesonia sp.]HIO27099.1 hypothetical protein [Flavobacteriaceae bacterium]